MSKWPERNSPHRQNYLKKFATPPTAASLVTKGSVTKISSKEVQPMPNGFYGQPAHSSSDRFGAIGVNFEKGAVTIKALEAAERVVAAGDAGLSDRDVMRFDFETLRSSGVPIREKNYRYYLDAVPTPKSYIVPDAPTNTPAVRPWK